MGISKTISDYLNLFKQLLPFGKAWTRSSKSNLDKILRAFAKSFHRSHLEIAEIIDESDPRSCIKTFEIWEKSFGLPDRCTSLEATMAERRMALINKITSNELFSKNYVYKTAKNLEYDIDIETYSPFVCGYSRCGDALNGSEDCRLDWCIGIKSARILKFTTGISACGEPLFATSYGNDLICILSRANHSHLNMIVNFIEE